jgi:hypothetical protein
VELAQHVGHRGGEVLGLRGVAMAQVYGGDLETFARGAASDLAAFTSVGSPWAAQSHVFGAHSALLHGDLDTALELAHQAGEVEPRSAWSGPARGYEILVHAWRGDADACQRLIDEEWGSLPRPGHRPAIGMIVKVQLVVQACVVAGLPELAGQLHPVVADWVDALPTNGFDFSITHRNAGMAAAAAERWEDATHHFEAALRMAVATANDLERPHIEHWYGSMLRARGRAEDRASAQTMLTSAVAQFQAFGMPLHEARARQVLAT